MSSAKRKTFRISLLILGAILLLAAGAGVWVATQSEEYIRRKLPGAVQKATDSLYRMEAGSVDINFATRDVTITDLELAPSAQHWAKLTKDYNLPPVRFSVRIPKLYIRHLSIKRYLEDKELVADGLHIVNPVIRITRLASALPPKEGEEPPKIERIRLGNITIENPDIIYTDEASSKKVNYAAKGGSIQLKDWRFELDGAPDSTRLFYAAHTQFDLRALTLPDPSGLYRYTVGSAAYDQTGSVVWIGELQIKPALSRQAFYKRVNMQKEIYTVRFPAIRLEGVDWQKLMAGTALIAQGGEIRDGDIAIYMDRVPPPNLQSKDGKFPHQLLMKLALPVHIPKLAVVNGQFAYTERNYKTMRAGTVAMTGIRGQVTNVTNMPARIRENGVCSIALKGVFKGSTVDAVFRFPLGDKAGAFSVDGGMTGMADGTRLNGITEPLALADIRSLSIDGIRFHIDGSEAGAKGHFTMRYHDLDVDLLEKEQTGGLGKKHVTTFVADKFLLFSANPSKEGKEVRSAQPAVDRDPTKSFFNVIWKTLFTGTLQTTARVGFLDDAVEKKARKDEEKRKEELLGPGRKKEKKGLLRRLRGKEQAAHE